MEQLMAEAHTTEPRPVPPITEEQLLECLTLGAMSEDEMAEEHRAMLRSLERKGLVKRVWVFVRSDP
jgi:hypothetical protein